MRTHFLLFDVGIVRMTFQICPHQYFQCFDFSKKSKWSHFLKKRNTTSQQAVAVNFQSQHVWKQLGRSSRSCYQFSLPATSLSRLEAMCTALVCGAQCSMPLRLGPWQSRTFNAFSGMTGQWSDRSAMSSHKTLLPLGRMSCVCSLASKTWTSSWRRKDFGGMDTFNDQTVPSSQPMTYRLKESGWPGSSWQRGVAESGSSLLSTLMIETPGDLVWDLPCVPLARYLEGGPLMWILSLNLHVNQKSGDDDDDQS